MCCKKISDTLIIDEQRAFNSRQKARGPIELIETPWEFDITITPVSVKRNVTEVRNICTVSGRRHQRKSYNSVRILLNYFHTHCTSSKEVLDIQLKLCIDVRSVVSLGVPTDRFTFQISPRDTLVFVREYFGLYRP